MINGYIDGQTLTIKTPTVVEESYDYLTCKFSFLTSDWDGLNKYAHFVNGDVVHDILLTDDEIKASDHLNLGKGTWEVNLHGSSTVDGVVSERITTTKALVVVEGTGRISDRLTIPVIQTLEASTINVWEVNPGIYWVRGRIKADPSTTVGNSTKSMLIVDYGYGGIGRQYILYEFASDSENITKPIYGYASSSPGLGTNYTLLGTSDGNALLHKTTPTGAISNPSYIMDAEGNDKIAPDIALSVIIGGGSSPYNNVIGGNGANVGTVTPNTTQLGTGADVSVVGGYDNSAGSISSKIISDHSKTEVGGEGHNAIYGGANNTIKTAGAFSMIGGGKQNTINNQNCFVSGMANTANGASSAIFGNNNTTGGVGAFVAGARNKANSSYTYAFGSDSEATTAYCMAIGNFAKASNLGQIAFSSAKLDHIGDAQHSIMSMQRKTTNDAIYNLGLMASNVSYKLEPNQSAVYDILVVCRDVANTDTASWKITAQASRGASGVPTISGLVITNIACATGLSGCTVNFVADSTGGTNVKIKGVATKTLKWSAKMSAVEITI